MMKSRQFLTTLLCPVVLSGAGLAGVAELNGRTGADDVKAARLMDQSWSNDKLAMLVEEARRAKAPGRDGPTLKVPGINSEPDRKPVTPDREKGPPLRISNVSGSGKNWRVVMSGGTGYTEQAHFGLGPWPGKEVENAWAKGFRITSVAGSAGRTLVVMSKGTRLTEQDTSPEGEYPKQWIQQRW